MKRRTIMDSRPSQKELHSLNKKIKKISPLDFSLMTIYPEYYEAIKSVNVNEGQITDCRLFITIRTLSLQLLEESKLTRGQKSILRSISKDLFNDPAFWQKTDEEVFAQINEMRERGEID